MQLETQFLSLTYNPMGYNMTFGLKYWEEDAGEKVEPPVIDTTKSVVVKRSVENLTNDQLVNRGLQAIGKQMQEEIDNYNAVKVALAAIDFAGTKNTLLQGGLDG